MRIAIVNDVSMVLVGLHQIIMGQPDMEVAWIAHDGAEAVDKTGKDKPDLILMDLMMPRMSGAEATRQIMEKTPCPILVVTASVTEYVSEVVRAISYGAIDAVATPIISTGKSLEGTQALLYKMKQVSLVSSSNIRNMMKQHHLHKAVTGGVRLAEGIIAIGASSGGPKAVLRVLDDISPDTTAAIVVVQHVDEGFAPRLVDWLNSRQNLPVQRAVAGEKLYAGHVYIAVSKDHLIVNQDQYLEYVSGPQDYPYRPSVDVLMNSIVDHWSLPACGVLLTGMGSDGAKGLLRMREKGCYTVAQDRVSSAVYGMPKAAHELDAAVDILPIDKIGETIQRYCDKKM